MKSKEPAFPEEQEGKWRKVASFLRKKAERFSYYSCFAISFSNSFMGAITDEFHLAYSPIGTLIKSSPFMITYTALYNENESSNENKRFKKLKQKLKASVDSFEMVAAGYIAGTVAGYLYKMMIR